MFIYFVDLHILISSLIMSIYFRLLTTTQWYVQELQSPFLNSLPR